MSFVDELNKNIPSEEAIYKKAITQIQERIDKYVEQEVNKLKQKLMRDAKNGLIKPGETLTDIIKFYYVSSILEKFFLSSYPANIIHEFNSVYTTERKPTKITKKNKLLKREKEIIEIKESIVFSKTFSMFINSLFNQFLAIDPSMKINLTLEIEMTSYKYNGKYDGETYYKRNHLKTSINLLKSDSYEIMCDQLPFTNFRFGKDGDFEYKDVSNLHLVLKYSLNLSKDKQTKNNI